MMCQVFSLIFYIVRRREQGIFLNYSCIMLALLNRNLLFSFFLSSFTRYYWWSLFALKLTTFFTKCLYCPLKMTLWKKSSCSVKAKKNILVSNSISRQLWSTLFCFEILGAPLDSTYRMNSSWHVLYLSIFVLFWILLIFT